MRLTYKNINYVLDMEENRIPVYVIENQKLFLDMVYNLYKQINENVEGNFKFFDDKYNEVSLYKNFMLITDIFNLNFKDKKIITAIFSSLKENSLNEEMYKMRLEVESILNKFIESLTYNFEFPLEFNTNFDYDALFKMYNIKIQENYENFLEKIIDYIKIIQKLTTVKYIVFINLKTFLSKNEIEILYRECFYRKINIILFENYENYSIIEAEKRIIIDSDLCEIY